MKEKKKSLGIKKKKIIIDYKKVERLIHVKERDINDELVRKHFLVQDLRALLEKTRKLNNNVESYLML